MVLKGSRTHLSDSSSTEKSLATLTVAAELALNGRPGGRGPVRNDPASSACTRLAHASASAIRWRRYVRTLALIVRSSAAPPEKCTRGTPHAKV